MIRFHFVDDFLSIGYAWLRIGALRFSLLLNCDDFDPAMKYSFKYSQLEERISSLELDIKVVFLSIFSCYFMQFHAWVYSHICMNLLLPVSDFFETRDFFFLTCDLTNFVADFTKPNLRALVSTFHMYECICLDFIHAGLRFAGVNFLIGSCFCI